MPIPARDVARISVLVPAYNAAATLQETLASIAQQSYGDFEVIIVDDGSSDATHEIATAFARRDPRFRVIRQANGGVAAARNTALAAARCALVAPLDADDLWHPDKLALQLQRFDADGGRAVLVYSWSVDIDQASHVLSRRLDLDEFEGDAYAALVYANFIGNASVPLIRRDALFAVGGWDPSLRARGAEGCEDWLAYLRLAERGPFALARGFLVGYRQSPHSMSRNVAAMARSFELVLHEASARHPELPARLYRWSRAAYDFYRAECLLHATPRFAFLRPLLGGILKDPAWLLRASTAHKLSRRLKLRPAPRTGPVPVGPIPQEHFRDARIEPPYVVSEGRLHDRRRLALGRMPIKMRT